MTSIRGRAEHRFDLLRQQAAESLEVDAPVPSGWCISAIARLGDERTIAAVQELQARLAPVGELYRYPRESLHLSLLGCTQREPVRPDAEGPRMDAIVEAFDRVVQGVDPVRVELGALNLVGSQFFVEVLTDEPVWASLRSRLAVELVKIGEKPMSYADVEPMHLNIARILRLDDPAEVRRLLTARPAVDAVLDIATVELVVTDFVVTPSTLTVAHTRHLDR